MIGAERDEITAAGVVEGFDLLPLRPVDVLELLIDRPWRAGVNDRAHVRREELLLLDEIREDVGILLSIVAVRAERRVEVRVLPLVQLGDALEVWRPERHV